jgi:PAS domain S-box-containing protein
VNDTDPFDHLELETRAGRLVQLLPDAIALVNEDGRIRFGNSRLEDLSEYRSEELVGRPIEVLLPETRRVGEHHGAPLHDRPDPRMETVLCRRGGSEVPVDIQFSSIEMDGKSCTIASIRDITERKRIEEALREREQRYRRIFEEGPLGIAVLDRSLRVMEVNHAIIKMSRRSSDELIGTQFPVVEDPAEAAEDREQMDRLFHGEIEGYDIEKRFRSKSGEIRYASIRTSVIHDEHGAPLHGLRIVEDVTERKRLEQQLALNAAAANAILTKLTAREAEILGLLSDGLSAPEMATRLSVSVRTVESHLANAYRKLGVRTKSDAVTEFEALSKAAAPVDLNDGPTSH